MARGGVCRPDLALLRQGTEPASNPKPATRDSERWTVGRRDSSAWWREMARRLADLDVEVNLASVDRVHLHLHGIGGGGPLRRERAVHDSADLGLEISGAHYFRDRLMYLPGK